MKSMTTIRKKRVIFYEIRITVYTDWIEELTKKFFESALLGFITHEKNRGRITAMEVKQETLWPKK
jgi:hypothetical protein